MVGATSRCHLASMWPGITEELKPAFREPVELPAGGEPAEAHGPQEAYEHCWLAPGGAFSTAAAQPVAATPVRNSPTIESGSLGRFSCG